MTDSQQADLQRNIRLFRVLFYFLWLVAAACAVGMFLVGWVDIGVILLVTLAIGVLGLVEFERFARSVRHA